MFSERLIQVNLRFFITQYSIFILTVIALLLGGCTGNYSGSKDNEPDNVLNPNETYKINFAGVDIILSYDPDDNSFNGYIENTTENVINRVRVGVHLSNGVELGPTPAVDLMPGERKAIRLSAKNFVFNSWTVHPEIEGNESQD
jgi:hypothetical protein